MLGIYCLIIIDIKGNSCLMDISVLDCRVIFWVEACSEVSSVGVVDGQVEVRIMGGMFLYKYVWDNGEIIFIVMQLLEGVYMVIVMDWQGCEVLVVVNILCIFEELAV